MKTREQKQKDLDALTEEFKKASAAMIVGFNKLTVPKEQELRNQLREAGVSYEVVKNTLCRKAAEAPFRAGLRAFKGVTAIAMAKATPSLVEGDFQVYEANPDVFTFKVGLVEGKVVALKDVEPSPACRRRRVVSKIMFLINCRPALVTVLSAVPRNLAIVVKQIGEQKGGEPPERKSEFCDSHNLKSQ